MAMCPTSLAIFAFSLPESASVRDVQTSVSREPTHSHVCVVFPISYLRPCKSRMVRASRNAPTLRLTISHLCRRPPSPLDSSSRRCLSVTRETVEGGGHAACHHPMPTGVGMEPATCLGAHTPASAAGGAFLGLKC